MAATVDDLAETVAGLVDAGFHATLERADHRREDELVYERLRWTIRRGQDVAIELEALRYPDGSESFFLELSRYHGLRTPSFPLDSWKLWPDRVEFKFYTHPDSGQGLTFILELAA